MSPIAVLLLVAVVLVVATLCAWLWGERRAAAVLQGAAGIATEYQTRAATLEQSVRGLEEQIRRDATRHGAELEEWKARSDRMMAELNMEQQAHRAAIGQVEAHKQREQALLEDFEEERRRSAQLTLDRDQERNAGASAREQLVETQAILDATKEKLCFLDDARRQLTEQMKLIATEVVEKSGKQLNDAQQEKLAALLSPVKERFEAFTKKVDETEQTRAREQGRLGEQLQQLMKSSTELDKGARDLTAALKGDNKVAGDWGEVTLARVLENTGLQEGREYTTQTSERDAEGNVLRPDVVVRLPEQKNLVIDAKGSLKSWTEYAAENTDANWTAFVTSARTHYQLLAKKNYPGLYGVTSVDFVLMFIPTEGAFLELVRREPDLVQDAWKKRVMLVGPSNLQWALRMVASLWRFEDQSQNAQEIARQAGDLYDKFVGFVEDLEKVGRSLDVAVSSYTDARKKLETGRGDLIGRAEKLRELGLSPKKRLPPRSLRPECGEEMPLLEGAP